MHDGVMLMERMLNMIGNTKGLVFTIALTVAFGTLGGCAALNPNQTKPSPSTTSAQEPSTSLDGAAISPADSSEGENAQEPIDAIQVQVTIDGDSFNLNLVDNETARAFADLLPLKVTMSELNGNEKYVQLDDALPSAPTSFPTIKAGDVMLYQDDYIVVFYETHPTSYAYTRIGEITDTTGLAEAVGSGSVNASFTLS